VRYYYRPKGKKGIAMPDLPPDHPKFLAAYAAASGEVPRAPVRSGTIGAAIIAYKASDEFRRGLAASTRSRRRTTLDEIAERYGAGRIADLRDDHIKLDLSRFTDHARNNRLKVWRAFGAWMAEEYRLDRNPAATVKRSKTDQSDGHTPWTLDDVEAFRSRWPINTVERLAFELIFWTGARVSDAIRLGEGNEDRDGWLTFNQVKTGGEVSVPFRRELPRFAEGRAEDLRLLHQAIDARIDRHLTFLTTRGGASRSPKSVSQWFAAKARDAGIKGKTAHGLRKLRAELCIQDGATTPQVAAWLGHESLKMVEHYGKKFSRRKALSKTNEERKSSNFGDQVPNLAIK
jgi:integrase